MSSAKHTRPLFSSSLRMAPSGPAQRETCCYAWHGAWPSHCLGMRPSLRPNKCPGLSVSASEPQEVVSPGSACRRGVPWGTVSSWVTGAEGPWSRRTNGRWRIKTTEIRTLSFRATATMATRAARSGGCVWHTARKKCRSSASWRIAAQAAWMSLARKRSSPERVIDPRWVPSPVERSVGTTPKNAASWRIFWSSRQSPMRARSWLATIHPIPGTVRRYVMQRASSGSV